MALEKFRSGALRNKYLSPLLYDNETYFICLSGAEKFSAILSPALIFSLVLSFVSRQKKERLHSAVFPSSNKGNCLCHPRKAGISAFGSTLWRIGGLF